MSTSDGIDPSLDALLQKLFDSELSAAEAASLQAALRRTPEARRRYLAWMEIHGTLRWEYAGEATPAAGRSQTPPAIGRSVSWRWIVRAAAMLLIVALVGYALKRHRFGAQGPAEVAAVTGSGSGFPFAVGDSLVIGRSYTVPAGGGIEITFGGGSRVIIEGPSTFDINSADSMALRSGKVAAYAQGGRFIVDTDAALVTDLGTEFGVGVQSGQPLSVEVFKGRVSVAPKAAGAPGNAVVATQTLTAGQSVQVTNGEVLLDPNGARRQHFVQHIVPPRSSLNFVDLISGGDGTGTAQGVGINPTTGRVEESASGSVILNGNGQYHRVPGVPVVDGVFVPDARTPTTTVDSVGHRFAFPPTSGTSYDYVWAGGSNVGRDDVTGRPISARLGNVDYASAAHWPLYLHSNKGLTIDLDAVRRLHPGQRLDRLQFTYGNSYDGVQPQTKLRPIADLFVLVDGRSRLERLAMFHDDGPAAADIALSDGDRFLTLAVTDGGDNIYDDWVVLGDPVFRLAAATP